MKKAEMKNEINVLKEHAEDVLSKENISLKEWIILIEHHRDIGNNLIDTLKEKLEITHADYM